MGSFRQFLEAEDAKVLILMRGVPGAGKSYKAQQLAGDTGVVYGTDEYFGPNYREKWKELEDKGAIWKQLDQWHKNNTIRVLKAMRLGISPIVVDNTNIRQQEFQTYLDIAEDYDYTVRYEESDHERWKQVRPLLGKGLKWPKNEPELTQAADFFAQNNQHGVPKDTILQMMRRFQEPPQNESSLRDLLQPVPQDPKWHKEGNAFRHTQLVRQQLQVAVEMLKDAAGDPNSAFANLDTNLNDSDINLLRLGGWLHDVGKRSATTINSRFDNWEYLYHRQNKPVPPGAKIAANRHQMPHHFEPMMQQLGKPWQQMHQNADPADKTDLWFLIRNHMSLHDGLWSKRLWPELIDENGKYKNERKIKLLLILVLMDRMGRYGEARPQFGFPAGLEALQDMQATADQVKEQHRLEQEKREKQQRFNNPEELIAHLKSVGLTPAQIEKNVRKKFG